MSITIINALKRKLERVPKKPGVYFFKNKFGRIIYIGKAINICKRVAQHLTPQKDEPPKANALRKEVCDIKWEVCDSEIDSLIEEARYIKKYSPRFNIIFRDDKNYAYACVTAEKPFPRILVVHQPRKTINGMPAFQKCVGQFTNAFALRQTLRLLRGAYPYCAAQPGSLKRPCLDFHMGRCLGACVDSTVQAQTKKNIAIIVQILSGERKGIMRRLITAMKRAAHRQEFIKAETYKLQIERLEKVFAHAPSLEQAWRPQQTKDSAEWLAVEQVLRSLLKTKRKMDRVEGYDISNISGKLAVGSMVVFTNGYPNKNQYRKFKIKYSGDTPNDPKMMAEVLSRRFAHAEWPTPNLILLDGGKGQLGAAMRIVPKKQLMLALAKEHEDIYLPGEHSPIRAASLGTPLLFFVQRIRNEAHRFAITYHKKLRSARLH